MVRDVALSVVLVEDDALFRDLLRIALAASGQLAVTGAFADGETALQQIPALRPQVAVLDIELAGGLNGIQLGRLLRRHLPSLGIVLLSHHHPGAFLSAVPEEEMAGWSYLLKGSVRSAGALLQAVLGVASGGVMMDPAVVRQARLRAGTPLDDLSPRQQAILALIAQGLSNAAIAEHLQIAVKTVENQINLLYHMLGIEASDSRVQPRVRATLTYLKAAGLR